VHKKYTALLNPCTDKTNVVVKVNNDILVFIGQGEGDTRWKGWAWKLLRTILFIELYSKIYIFAYKYKVKWKKKSIYADYLVCNIF